MKGKSIYKSRITFTLNEEYEIVFNASAVFPFYVI